MPQPILNNSLDIFAQGSTQLAAKGIDQSLSQDQFLLFILVLLSFALIAYAWRKRD